MKRTRLLSVITAAALLFSISTSAASGMLYAMKDTRGYNGTDISITDADKQAPEITEATVSAAIEASRRVLPDTSEYTKFGYNSSYTVGEYGKQTLLSLYWTSEESGKRADVSVSTDGFISAFSVSYDRVRDKPVPIISQAEAVKAAYEFVSGANPDHAKYFDTEHARVAYSSSSGTYTVSFTANDGGTVISGATAQVRMSYLTGEIYSLTVSIPSNLVDTSDTAMSDGAVKSAFNEKLPMQLRYVVKYDSETKKSYVDLVYRPEVSGKLIGADGELYDIKYVYAGGGYKYAMGANVAADSTAAEAETADEAFVMTGAEMSGVEYQSGFLTPERVREVIMSSGKFALDESMGIVNSSLSKRSSAFTGKDSYIISVDFKSEKNSAYAELDAESGEILWFAAYDTAMRADEPIVYTAETLPYPVEEYRAASDELIKSLYPDTYAEYVYSDEHADSGWIRESGEYNEYDNAYYTYVRHSQGLPFERDRITVSVKLKDMSIVKVYYSYTDCEFPSVEGIITPEDAFDIYAENVGTVPRLYPAVKLEEGVIYIAESDISSAEKKLFIGYVYDSPYYQIDAHTGECEKRNSVQEYFKDTAFTDITDKRVLEAVSKLSDMNIIKRAELFEPARAITQGEFAAMLSPVSPIPEAYAVKGDDTAVFGEDYDPDLPLTRAMAAKALVYARGYDEVAKLTGIYVTRFDDDAKIDGSVKGYVAIAQGLGLLDIPSITDNFESDAELTRAEAALMVYNEASSVR
ncbi:MAG: hypothetical protein IJ391_08890 [Clostridia bacterium]|nr:hypothetical protein [Clostridia bacterium]